MKAKRLRYWIEKPEGNLWFDVKNKTLKPFPEHRHEVTNILTVFSIKAVKKVVRKNKGHILRVTAVRPNNKGNRVLKEFDIWC
jgi:hypothetical protein